VLAAHPDDETIGCGATVAGLRRAGADVKLIVATDGRYGAFDLDPMDVASTRAEELVKAASELGIDASEIELWGMEDGTLMERGPTLGARLTEIVQGWHPDCLMVTCRLDPHPDHRALARAAARGARDGGVRLMEYPVWTRHSPSRALLTALPSWDNARYLRSLPGRRVWVDSREDADAKRAALRCYSSQASEGPLTDSFTQMFTRSYEVFVVTRP
jgi:LmbE family N-acetylglucosaminyl deacetylase